MNTFTIEMNNGVVHVNEIPDINTDYLVSMCGFLDDGIIARLWVNGVEWR